MWGGDGGEKEGGGSKGSESWSRALHATGKGGWNGGCKDSGTRKEGSLCPEPADTCKPTHTPAGRQASGAHTSASRQEAHGRVGG